MLENSVPMRAVLTAMRDSEGERILSPGEARIAIYMMALRETGATFAHVVSAARISRSYGQRVARKANIEFPDYAPRAPKEKK